MADIAIRVNGTDRAVSVDPRTSLLDLLRERLGLTGPKKGCDHGQCGACTVLIDGRRANACLALAVAQDGADVTTVEGLAAGDGGPGQDGQIGRAHL
jgi:xanthine dehydrogenase YagT iron-sulfur-binding subunit